MSYKLLLFSLTLLVPGSTIVQVPRDEDKEMFNKGRERDQKTIDDAVNGWWTASQKTHNERIQWWRDAKFGMFIHWGLYSLWRLNSIPRI